MTELERRLSATVERCDELHVESAAHRDRADNAEKEIEEQRRWRIDAEAVHDAALKETERLQAIIDRVGEIAPQLQNCHVHGEDGTVAKLITALYAALGRT